MAYSVPIHALWTQEVEIVNLKIKEQDGLHKQSQQLNKNRIVISDRNAKIEEIRQGFIDWPAPRVSTIKSVRFMAFPSWSRRKTLPKSCSTAPPTTSS